MTSEPIANYGMVSDCRSAALVSAAGSVDWLCFPRFDSPSVFGRVLGEDAGFWLIRPVGEHSSARRYLGPTMVIETVHTTAGGAVSVTDALVLGEGNRGHELGAGASGTLLRDLVATSGDLSERELAHLPGWRDSSPVRVGNGAWNQRQLDVYGELLDAAATLPDYLNDMEPGTRVFLADAADTAASRWQSQDQGIWEVRGAPRHYLHSKLMCWVAVDRAIALARALDAEDRIPRWKQVRAQLADSIRLNGWSDSAGAYIQAYGSEDLDASALLSIVGCIPADDPRMLATIDAIEHRLTDSRGLVYRYQSDDGLAGEEGTFLLCTSWLAHALALAGQTQRARTVFERAAGFATDLGLLAEEIAPDSSELLGNFPQAFSHIGLVNAAWAIRMAEDTHGHPDAGDGDAR